MDKPKHKDGMLAAGKKRLEQFRQKKQGKGSASKHTKPETDIEHGRLEADAEHVFSKGSRAKGSMKRTSSDDVEAANNRSDSSNEAPINLKVVSADDAASQINTEHSSTSDLDHGSAHSFNPEANELEQCSEAAKEKLAIGNIEVCLRMDSLDSLGVHLSSSPPITGYSETPIQQESLVGGFDSGRVSVAPDLSINMADLVVPDINVNHDLVNYGDGTTELNGESIVMNSFCSDHAEAVQACDKEQELMSSLESGAAGMPLCSSTNQPFLTAADGDEKASELHVDTEHSQEADFTGSNCSERHDLNNGALGMLPGFNATSANLECTGVATQVMNKEQELSSSSDSEAGTLHLPDSKSKPEYDDTAHLAVLRPEVDLTPVSEAPSGAHALESHYEDIVKDSNPVEYSNMEQPRTEELNDTNSDSVVKGMPLDSSFHIAVSRPEVDLPPVSEDSRGAHALESHYEDIVMDSGPVEHFNMEQPRTEELNDTDSDIGVMPLDSSLNQAGVGLNNDSGLKESSDDSYQGGMAVEPREDMTSIAGSIAGAEEATVPEVSEPADGIVQSDCVCPGALEHDNTVLSLRTAELTASSFSIGEDATSVALMEDRGESSLEHISDEGLNLNIVLDKIPETNVERGSTSSGFHENIEAEVSSRDGEVTNVNTARTGVSGTAVQPEQGAKESVYVESIVNPVQESLSGDGLSCSRSLQIVEAEQASGEDQIMKTSTSLIEGGVDSTGIMELEEEHCSVIPSEFEGTAEHTSKLNSPEGIVTSGAFHHSTAVSSNILGSDNGIGISDSIMDMQSDATARCEEEDVDSGLVPSGKTEEVRGVVEEVMTNEGSDSSMGEMQLRMDKVVEELVPGHNLAEVATIPVMEMAPTSVFSSASLDHEEGLDQRGLPCCSEELYRTEVSLESKIDEPDIAPCSLAVDHGFLNPIENNVDDGVLGSTYMQHEVDTSPALDAEANTTEQRTDNGLSGNGSSKHESDIFPLPLKDDLAHEVDNSPALDAEISLANTTEQRTDNGLSGNGSSKHESDIVPSPRKDDLPRELISSAVVHDREADSDSDVTKPFQSSLDAEPTLDFNHAENQEHVLTSDGTVGDHVEVTGASSERGQELVEVSQFEPAVQSCSMSKPEIDSIISDSSKSYEVMSLAASPDDYGIELPLVTSPNEALEGETEHCFLNPLSQELSRDFGADVNQDGPARLAFQSAQEGDLLTGQESKGSDKSELPLESVQEGHLLTGHDSRGFDDLPLIDEAGVFQHVEDVGFEEQCRSNKIGLSISSGNELQGDVKEEKELEDVIRELRDSLTMKETELENLSSLLSSQAAKNSEEQDMAVKVLMHVVKRLGPLVCQGSNVNEDADLHAHHLKPFVVDNGGIQGTESIDLDGFLQACDHWMDKVQKDLEEKRQMEVTGRQLEDELFMKDTDIEGLMKKVKQLSQNCDELQKESEQKQHLESHVGQLEELLTIRDMDMGRLSDKLSELSQNCDRAMGEAAEAVEERANLEGELKYFQELHAEKESRASLLEDLISIKDTDLERLSDKVAELSQNYDLAMGELARSVEERLSLAGELNHLQRLYAEQEEGRLRMCTQASALADKVSALLSPSSIAIETVHGDAFGTLEILVASLQEHYETVCRENKDLLLRGSDSDAAYELEVKNLRALVSGKEAELAHVQEKVDCLTNELAKTKEDGERRVQEAEQKALGVRERLSLAVTKGKGLVQQRDNLKQLLAEKTAELEALSLSYKQELHVMKVALNEAESKVKLNSEAVERVEALESELSYIRNSANALRESFLQKDAVLQKIEELLEDANLLEELQIKDIYEKIEWLLEAYTQQTSTSEGHDHSETMATRGMDTFSVAEQTSQMQEIEQLNRKCDELLRKYRGMAEQSAMLEQSLLERNLLIQRWEEMLDAVDMPAAVRSKEPEDKIEWLGTAVSDAHTSIAHLQAETESLQTTVDNLNHALRKLQEENCVLSIELAAKDNDLRTMAVDLEDVTSKYNSLSRPTQESSDEIGMSLPQAGVRGLEESECKQEASQQPQFQVEDSEAFITNIRTLLSEVVQENEVDKIFSGVPASTAFETSVKLLVGNSKVWSAEATDTKEKLAELTSAMRMAEKDQEMELQSLHEALSLKTLELSNLTIQLEGLATKNTLLEDEVDNLQRKVEVKSEELSCARDELGKSQLEVSQGEERLASVREKLSMAVKKGKSVVQQRDALKHSLEEKTAELNQLRKEQEAENLALIKAKQSLKHQLQQVEMLEAELSSSRNYASSLEKSLQESNRAIQKFAEHSRMRN